MKCQSGAGLSMLLAGVLMSGSVTWGADVKVILDTTNGASAFFVNDARTNPVVKVDSFGHMTYFGRRTGPGLDQYQGSIYVAEDYVGGDPTSGHFIKVVGDNQDVGLLSYSSQDKGSASDIDFYRARGTTNAPLAVQLNGKTGSLRFKGHNGATFLDTAQIVVNAGSVVDSTRVSCTMDFMTVAQTGSTWPATRMGINEDGVVWGVGFVNTSDARLKDHVSTLSNTLQTVRELRGVEYYWNDQARNEKGLDEKKHLGFIAQEVQRPLPDAVTSNRDGTLMIDYNALVPVLVEAIKEQQAQIEALQTRVSALEAK